MQLFAVLSIAVCNSLSFRTSHSSKCEPLLHWPMHLCTVVSLYTMWPVDRHSSFFRLSYSCLQILFHKPSPCLTLLTLSHCYHSPTHWLPTTAVSPVLTHPSAPCDSSPWLVMTLLCCLATSPYYHYVPSNAPISKLLPRCCWFPLSHLSSLHFFFFF